MRGHGVGQARDVVAMEVLLLLLVLVLVEFIGLVIVAMVVMVVVVVLLVVHGVRSLVEVTHLVQVLAQRGGLHGLVEIYIELVFQ